MTAGASRSSHSNQHPDLPLDERINNSGNLGNISAPTQPTVGRKYDANSKMTRTGKLLRILENAKMIKDFIWLGSSALQETVVLKVWPKYKAVPIERIIDIYSVRKKINEARGNAIDGFDSLLAGLQRTKCKRLGIHLVIDSTGAEYGIFTDPDISELIGILRFPRKQKADKREG